MDLPSQMTRHLGTRFALLCSRFDALLGKSSGEQKNELRALAVVKATRTGGGFLVLKGTASLVRGPVEGGAGRNSEMTWLP